LDTAEIRLAAGLAGVVEQAAAGAEQNRHQVELDLVEQAGAEQLLGDAGAVCKDVLAAGCCFARPSAVISGDEVLVRLVGEHEAGHRDRFSRSTGV